MSQYTNTLVNLSYVSGMAILIIGLVDRKMRFMDVSDIQWIILSLVLGIFLPVLLKAFVFTIPPLAGGGDGGGVERLKGSCKYFCLGMYKKPFALISASVAIISFPLEQHLI